MGSMFAAVVLLALAAAAGDLPAKLSASRPWVGDWVLTVKPATGPRSSHIQSQFKQVGTRVNGVAAWQRSGGSVEALLVHARTCTALKRSRVFAAFCKTSPGKKIAGTFTLRTVGKKAVNGFFEGIVKSDKRFVARLFKPNHKTVVATISATKSAPKVSPPAPPKPAPQPKPPQQPTPPTEKSCVPQTFDMTDGSQRFQAQFSTFEPPDLTDPNANHYQATCRWVVGGTQEEAFIVKINFQPPGAPGLREAGDCGAKPTDAGFSPRDYEDGYYTYAFSLKRHLGVEGTARYNRYVEGGNLKFLEEKVLSEIEKQKVGLPC
jgi:hypothetical protein